MAADDEDIKKEGEPEATTATGKTSPPPPPPGKGPVIKAATPGQKGAVVANRADLLAQIREGKGLKKQEEIREKRPAPEQPALRGAALDAMVAQAQAKAADTKDDNTWDDDPEPARVTPTPPKAVKVEAPVAAKVAPVAAKVEPVAAKVEPVAQKAEKSTAEGAAVTAPEEPVDYTKFLAGKLAPRRAVIQVEDNDEDQVWDADNDEVDEVDEVKPKAVAAGTPEAVPAEIPEAVQAEIPEAVAVVPTATTPPLPPTRTATAEEVQENVRKFKAIDEARRAEALAEEQADKERPPVPPVPEEERPNEPPPVPVRSASPDTTVQERAAEASDTAEVSDAAEASNAAEVSDATEASNALGIVELDEEDLPPVSVQPVAPPQVVQETGPTVTAEEVKKAIRDSYNKLSAPDKDEISAEYTRAQAQFEFSNAKIPNMEAAIKLVAIAKKLESGTSSKEERDQVVKDLKEFYQAVGKPPAPKEPQIEIERLSTLITPPIKPAAKLAAETPVAKAPVGKPPVVEPVVATPVAKTPVGKPSVAEPPVIATPVATTPVGKPPLAEPTVVATPVATTPVGKPSIAEPPVVATPVASAESTNASPGDSTATPVTPPTLPATALPVTPNPTATLAAAPDQEPQADKEEDKDAFDQMKDSLDKQIKDWPQVKGDGGEALGEQIIALFALAATLLKGTASIPLESVFNAKSDELKAIKRERENAQNRVDEIREDLEDAEPGSEEETILTQNLNTARAELNSVDQRMVQVANETHQAVREDLRNQVQNAGQDASELESTRSFNARPPVPSRGANDEPHREPPQVLPREKGAPPLIPLREEGAPPVLSLEEQLAKRRELEASKIQAANKKPPQPPPRSSTSVSAGTPSAQPVAGPNVAAPIVPSGAASKALPALPENALEKAQKAWNQIMAKLPEADKARILSQSNIGNVLRADNPALTGSAIQSLITLAKKDNISLSDVQGVLQNFMPGQSAASPTTSRPRAATMPITPTSEATASVSEVEAAAEPQSIFRRAIGAAASGLSSLIGLKQKEPARRASTPPPVQSSTQATTTPQTREETAREEALNVSTRSATPILRALTIEQGPQAAFGGLQMKLSELQAKIEPKKDSYGITNMKYFDTPPETIRGLEAKPTLSLEMQTDKPNVKNYVHLQNDAQGGIEFRASKNAANTTLQNICKLAVENAPPNTNFAVPAGAANAAKIKEYLSAAIAAQPPERREKLSVDGKNIDARATVTPRQEPSQTPNLGSKSGG